MLGDVWRLLLRLLSAAIFVLALSTSAVGAAATEPIVIGIVAPLTGPASAVGSGHRLGAEAAVRQLNRQGGIRGRRVVLRLFDDTSNPTQGVIRMQELVADPNVVAVVGSGFPASALASAPMATRAGVPYVSMAPLHTLVYPPRPYVYTTAHTSRVVAYKLAAHLRAEGVRRIAVLRGNTSVGQEGAHVLRELAGRYGFDIVSDRVFPLTTTTFVADLVAVKNSGAQALWVWAVDTAAVTITKEARQLRIESRAIPRARITCASIITPV
jgi:branched-chain amino acid transport system substrate-binding protein